MTTKNNLILVVNDFSNDLELVTNRIEQSKDDYDRIRILHSEEITQHARDLFPSHVDFEFLGRGVLPSSISSALFPTTVKVRSTYHLFKWKIHRLWAVRDFYLRKSIAAIFKSLGLIRQYAFKAIRLLIMSAYKIVAPILTLIISIFVEWPIALFISWIPSKSDHLQVDSGKSGLFSKIYQLYSNFRSKIYMKRLNRIRKQYESADFEYINIMTSDS